MTEEAKYEAVRRIGGVEIRRYAGMILAAVPGLPDSQAFGILFRYITGNNRSRQDIPMTAPVVSATRSSERIAMTAPVVSAEGSFAFVLPANYSLETAPGPSDERIRLMKVPPRLVATLRFRGVARTRLVRRKTEELFAALQGIRTKGGPFLMRYNPPYTPGFLRRNEVGIEVEP